MIGVVLLYVGAVLTVNGIWLYGAYRAQQRAERERAGQASSEVIEQEQRRDPFVIQNKEIAILNFFTGGVGVVIATASAVYGLLNDDVPSFATAGFVLLFAFTFIWVALNQFIGADGKGLGWYSLFVAITAIPTGAIVLDDSEGDIFSIWLGADWFAWAFLWFLFFLLLARGMPILRFTGIVTTFEGIATSWALAYVLLTEKISGL